MLAEMPEEQTIEKIARQLSNKLAQLTELQQSINSDQASLNSSFTMHARYNDHTTGLVVAIRKMNEGLFLGEDQIKTDIQIVKERIHKSDLECSKLTAEVGILLLKLRARVGSAHLPQLLECIKILSSSSNNFIITLLSELNREDVQIWSSFKLENKKLTPNNIANVKNIMARINAYKGNTDELIKCCQLEIVSLENLTITKDIIDDLRFIAPLISNISSLSLMHCNIEDIFIRDTLNPLLLQISSALVSLNLSFNKLTYVGASRLIEGLTACHTLKSLDLSANHIGCEKNAFEKLKKDFSRWPSIKVLIGQNFLDKSCKAVQRKLSLCYSDFFQTAPVETVSLLNSTYQISSSNWVVALVCKKGTEHAMLYMEGMRKNGQRFLERYHIMTEGITSPARVEIEDIALKHFDTQAYHIFPHPISRRDGHTLKILIRADKNKPINFSKYYPSCSQGKVNCLSWCVQKLAAVDIIIDTTLWNFPSHAAKKSSGCVML